MPAGRGWESPGLGQLGVGDRVRTRGWLAWNGLEPALGTALSTGVKESLDNSAMHSDIRVECLALASSSRYSALVAEF